MCRQFFDSDDPDVTATDLPAMGGHEGHWELRSNVHTKQLQSRHAGRDRVQWQGQHDSSDSDAVGVCGRRGDVGALGHAPEA